MAVRIVTDSACDLPPQLVEELGIVVVPLTIRFGDEELVDREELTPDVFWDRLRTDPVLPQTAAPAAGAFAAAFQEVFDAGASGIVCIDVSSRLSATMQSAQVAAATFPVDRPVAVIDSKSVSMGLGTLCLGAARQAADGMAFADIVADVFDRRDRTRLFACLDTLEFLRRGGRIGNARAVVGSMLSIKPLVELRDGVVEDAGRVRTRSRALHALVARVAAQRVEHVAVLHGQAPDLGDFLDLLEPTVPREQIVVGLVGPVIGTHAGPGVLGVTFQVPD